MIAAKGMELAQILRSCLSNHPNAPPALLVGGRGPPTLHDLCIRTAAIYATTSLYEFHRQKIHSLEILGEAGLGGPVGGPPPLDPQSMDVYVQESMWEAVFPLLDQHFFQLVPGHLYEQFLDHVLCALEVAGHYDYVGKQLMQYIILFFPKHTRRFRAQRYVDRVLMPTISCLIKCSQIEELYLEKADSPAITTYLLAHILKFMNRLRVLALPKQCDDDVASIVGINCPKLESVVLTGTAITNVGLSWLLCCRKLHTIIMQGFFQGVSPKGVALLLNGLPGLRHVIYDVMSDVLTYIDFNTCEAVFPQFGLKTMLFHSMELLSSNHLELVTKLCPQIEWLSLDSALFYNLEGLGLLPRMRLLRLNYKSRPVDQTVVDFVSLNGRNIVTLHLLEVKDLSLEDLYLTIGQCLNLETLVLCDCSVKPDWDQPVRYNRQSPLSTSVDHLQLFSLQILPGQLVNFIALFRDLQILETDRCELDLNQIKCVLLDQNELHTFRCTQWSHTSAQNLTNLQMAFRNCKLQMDRQEFAFEEDFNQTMAATLLSEYAGFSPLVNFDTIST